MKHVLILTAFVVSLMTAAVALPHALAYEFSEHERQVEADSRQRMQDQRQLDQALQAQRQQQEQRSLQENKQFNPSAFNPPAPYNMYDQNGKPSVCRRGGDGAVFCQ